VQDCGRQGSSTWVTHFGRVDCDCGTDCAKDVDVNVNGDWNENVQCVGKDAKMGEMVGGLGRDLHADADLIRDCDRSEDAICNTKTWTGVPTDWSWRTH